MNTFCSHCPFQPFEAWVAAPSSSYGEVLEWKLVSGMGPLWRLLQPVCLQLTGKKGDTSGPKPCV